LTTPIDLLGSNRNPAVLYLTHREAATTPPPATRGPPDAAGDRHMTRPRQLDIDAVQSHLREFARERDWEQYHTPKNLVMALAGEVGELIELFQWLDVGEASAIMSDARQAERVRGELADILQYVIRLADVLDVDLPQALWAKLEINAQKYPVTLSKGNATKYTDFESGER
jgi:NTP pyrophosphatase (non-canonical NTP hydrolase)